MPEGPEVRRTADWLDVNFVCKTLIRTEPFRDGEIQLPSRLNEVKVYGKKILFVFEGFCLQSKLGLSGHWARYKTKYTKDTLFFDENSILYFNDMLKFGKLTHTSVEDGLKWVKDGGTDVLDESLAERDSGANYTLTALNKLSVSHKNKNICSVLLDQKLISGIGNYLKSDILYKAGISPYAKIGDLSTEEIVILSECILEIVCDSYMKNGYLMNYFESAYTTKSTYSPLIYGRQTVDGKVVSSVKIGGRVTYFCPATQVKGEVGRK